MVSHYFYINYFYNCTLYPGYLQVISIIERKLKCAYIVHGNERKYDRTVELCLLVQIVHFENSWIQHFIRLALCLFAFLSTEFFHSSSRARGRFQSTVGFWSQRWRAGELGGQDFVLAKSSSFVEVEDFLDK